MKSSIFERMSTKTKIILISTLILIIVILSAFIYIFLTYGTMGVYFTIIGIMIVFAVIVWVYTEANRPRREPSLEQLEERRAYYQRTGELNSRRGYEKT